jgi:hypothetical protein
MLIQQHDHPAVFIFDIVLFFLLYMPPLCLSPDVTDLLTIHLCLFVRNLILMATKKAAESTLYHLSPKGFWKKFRMVSLSQKYPETSLILFRCLSGDAVVVNPEISSGLPIAGVNRYPQPASRPERYATPATQGAGVFKYGLNERGSCRAQHLTLLRIHTGSVTSDESILNFLWSLSRTFPRSFYNLRKTKRTSASTYSVQAQYSTCSCSCSSTPTPAGDTGPGQSSVLAIAKPLDLAAAVISVTSRRKVYSVSKLPPVIPIPFKRWRATLAEEAPHDHNAYFPMLLYK